ncbi:hypothetical protein, partial [Nocardia neocaledoniensis]|uniref:hypothetical protein n=1 Tax=Nocardia neocaledoniensis TaxID=236511 RepID=UPI002454688C
MRAVGGAGHHARVVDPFNRLGTGPGRVDENEEQVAKLLIHAFLEDLRDAYRRRIWRPSSWRRTAYPVAL